MNGFKDFRVVSRLEESLKIGDSVSDEEAAKAGDLDGSNENGFSSTNENDDMKTEKGFTESEKNESAYCETSELQTHSMISIVASSGNETDQISREL